MSNNHDDDLIINDADLDLLDKTIDEIEDLPGFEVPVNGRYLLKANRKFKKVNDKACVEVEFEVMECLKQNDDSESATVPGTKFSQLFFLSGDDEAVRISVGMLKQLVKPLAEKTGVKNMLSLVREELKDWLMMATVTRRQDRKNPEIYRARLSLIETT